jgi:hypothetical protein
LLSELFSVLLALVFAFGSALFSELSLDLGLSEAPLEDFLA